MPDKTEQMIKPMMHHVNLKTNRLNEMIDWYALVIGTKVNFRFPGGAFISNDRANHRIALLTVPGLQDDPQKFVHTGLHHTAFEYGTFADLMSSYARLKEKGIEPQVCLNHGLTISLYYSILIKTWLSCRLTISEIGTHRQNGCAQRKIFAEIRSVRSLTPIWFLLLIKAVQASSRSKPTRGRENIPLIPFPHQIDLTM